MREKNMCIRMYWQTMRWANDIADTRINNWNNRNEKNLGADYKCRKKNRIALPCSQLCIGFVPFHSSSLLLVVFFYLSRLSWLLGDNKTQNILCYRNSLPHTHTQKQREINIIMIMYLRIKHVTEIDPVVRNYLREFIELWM